MKTLALCLCLFSTWATAAGSAEDVFGRWERIDISEIYKPIPDSRLRSDSLGSVTNEYRAIASNPLNAQELSAVLI